VTRPRAFFFGTEAGGEGVDRIGVELGSSPDLDDFVARHVAGTRFLLVPIREGVEAVSEVRLEVLRLQKRFVIEKELSRMFARGDERAQWSLPTLLEDSGFQSEFDAGVGGRIGYRLSRPGRVPVVISSRLADATRRAINLAWVTKELLIGAAGAPSKAVLAAISRLVARTDRPEAEVREKAAAEGLEVAE
jgi:hypothetical protein